MRRRVEKRGGRRRGGETRRISNIIGNKTLHYTIRYYTVYCGECNTI